MAVPKTPTRKALSKYFDDQDILRRFEQLFETVGQTIPGVITNIEIAGDSSNAQINNALAQIKNLDDFAEELEFLMHSL